MKLASFKADNRPTYGVLSGDELREPGDVFRTRYPDLRATIAAGVLGELETGDFAATYDVDSVQFLPLIPNPDKILCVGVNYRPHIEEMGHDIPDHPVVFVRFPGSQTGHNQPVLRPRISGKFDFEGEFALVIGKSARHVSRVDALDYIAGYCRFMDGSVRDWQKHTMQFTPGKNFDSSGSMGPWLVTSDEVADPSVLTLRVLLDIHGVTPRRCDRYRYTRWSWRGTHPSEVAEGGRFGRSGHSGSRPAGQSSRRRIARHVTLSVDFADKASPHVMYYLYNKNRRNDQKTPGIVIKD